MNMENEAKTERGSIVINLRPGTNLHIGEDIIIQLNNGKRGQTRPARLRIIAPKTIGIRREQDVELDGEK